MLLVVMANAFSNQLSSIAYDPTHCILRLDETSVRKA